MRSWTEPTRASWFDAVRDLGHLSRFRAGTVRRRAAVGVGAVLALGLTLAFAVLPARADRVRDPELAEILGTAASGLEGNLTLGFVGVLALAIAGSMGTGGGRELLSRSEAMVHPISPLTEHLGALALTPLNLAWLIQAWALLAATSLVSPPDRVVGAQVVTVLWLVVATATGQAVGWAVEGVRRTPHGVMVVRLGSAAVGLVLLVLHLTGTLGPTARALPTSWVVETGATTRWPVAAVLLLALLPVMVWVGALPAKWALGLPPREELRVDSGIHEARHAPEPRWLSPDLALLRRLDRGSVWRSVGMRRGLMVLGIGPALLALATGLTWGSVLMLPGLAASGAALLFGVNAWCLDGKGMVWRETLPVSPAVVFDARALVLAECLAAVSTITIVAASIRNGLPSATIGVAVLSCWVVVVYQVLAISLSWSVRNPFGVDLSSPRATPAPHAVMAGYAGRLSLSTTFTGLLFAVLAVLNWWWLPLVVAPFFLAWSTVRLVRARRRWLQPAQRARIALTVAAV